MTSKEECCPVFDPKPYEDQVIEWKDKLFMKDSMRTFMHMPLFGVFGKACVRMMKNIEDADARVDDKDFIMLCGDPSPWKSELFINVSKEVPGAENVRLTGKYLTRVYDAPFKDVRKWVKDLRDYTREKGEKLLDMYFYYTTCPKCAEKYGHNYVVGFAKIG